MSRPMEAIAEINVRSDFCCGRQLVATYFGVSQEEGGTVLVTGGRLSGSDGAAAPPAPRSLRGAAPPGWAQGLPCADAGPRTAPQHRLVIVCCVDEKQQTEKPLS